MEGMESLEEVYGGREFMEEKGGNVGVICRKHI